jgi:hypothetical protein
MKQLKRFHLEVSELKRLIKDSLLNPNSEYYSDVKGDLEDARAMLAEIEKLEKFEGSLEDAQKVINVKVFQPIHSWVFFFTSLSEVEYEKGEDFIRLMIDGVTLAKIPIDL